MSIFRQPSLQPSQMRLRSCAHFSGCRCSKLAGAPKPGEQLTLDANEDVFEQFDQLWQLLVPTSGQCETVQGEVIRIAGKVGYEIYNNGGVNWGRSFTALLRQYLTIVASGQAWPLLI